MNETTQQLDISQPSQALLDRNVIAGYTGDMNNATTLFEHAIGCSVSAYELSTLARYVKQELKNNRKAEEILQKAIDDINSFDDGMYMQSIAKYFIPTMLPPYAEKMYKYAVTVEELSYSVDFFRRYDKAKCQPILEKIEAQAATIEDYLQLCSMLELFDVEWAKRVFDRAENLAATIADYLLLVNEQSFFYGLPKFLKPAAIRSAMLQNVVSRAKTAEDFYQLSDFFADHAGKLDYKNKVKDLQHEKKLSK